MLLSTCACFKCTCMSCDSLQAPVRDHMLACFSKSPSNSSIIRADVDSLKSSLISSFSVNLTHIMASYSLRLQIIRHYDGILRLLDLLPATQHAHFVIGTLKEEIFDNQGGNQQHEMFVTDSASPSCDRSGSHQGHLSQFVSSDGSVLSNLWYIPHFSEVSVLASTQPKFWPLP